MSLEENIRFVFLIVICESLNNISTISSSEERIFASSRTAFLGKIYFKSSPL